MSKTNIFRLTIPQNKYRQIIKYISIKILKRGTFQKIQNIYFEWKKREFS